MTGRNNSSHDDGNGKKSHLKKLPPEVMSNIFSFLDPREATIAVQGLNEFDDQNDLQSILVDLTYEKYVHLVDKKEKTEDERREWESILKAIKVISPIVHELEENLISSKDTSFQEQQIDEIIKLVPLSRKIIFSFMLNAREANYPDILSLKKENVSQGIVEGLLSLGKYVDWSEKFFGEEVEANDYNNEQKAIIRNYIKSKKILLVKSNPVNNEQAIIEQVRKIVPKFMTFSKALAENADLREAEYILLTVEDCQREEFISELSRVMSNESNSNLPLIFDGSERRVECSLRKVQNLNIRACIVFDPDASINIDSLFAEFTSLTDVTLSGLNAETIGNGFLWSCKSLTNADLSGLSIKTIDQNFLLECTSLTDLDLSGLNTETIGNFFLTHSSFTRLTNVDLSGLNTETIGDSFLSNCTNLTKVDLSWLKTKTIGNFFLYGCTSLTDVDLSGLSTKTIGNNFLGDCKDLTNVDLSGLNTETIGDGFLCVCTSLTDVDLSGLSTKTIGNGFLSGCTSLTNVNLSGLNTETIGNAFLWNCTSLTDVDLSGLNVETIDNDGFLVNCTSLKRIIIDDNTSQVLVDAIKKYCVSNPQTTIIEQNHPSSSPTRTRPR